jgi:UDP-N-acetyl-D-galactosamine dehydrogenase
MDTIKLAVIGLGYVGLPLAVEFSKIRKVVGYDIDQNRISELITGLDRTLEVTQNELKESKNLFFTNRIKEIAKCNIFIVTVPTPIDKSRRPDLLPLINACKLVSSILKKGDIVIFESTVYPGTTEEVCVPLLETGSGLIFNKDFYCGYSPERINPGDKEHRISNVIKVTSGSTPYIAKKIDELYSEIAKAGTYKAESIKIAEAAKVIENTQRDLNIALMNELSIIFNLLKIDTESVLKAAETKWNFISFRPGLVGGHCIGVDPYYLTAKAEELGYHPEIILAGRRLNDSMAKYIVSNLIKCMSKQRISIVNSKILIMGFTFKENCPDIRNTKVTDVVEELQDYGANIKIYDPWVNLNNKEHQFSQIFISEPNDEKYDAIIIAVPHDKFREIGIKKIRKYCKKNGVIYDLKHIFHENESDIRL